MTPGFEFPQPAELARLSDEYYAKPNRDVSFVEWVIQRQLERKASTSRRRRGTSLLYNRIPCQKCQDVGITKHSTHYASGGLYLCADHYFTSAKENTK